MLLRKFEELAPQGRDTRGLLALGLFFPRATTNAEKGLKNKLDIEFYLTHNFAL
jgi:hypothetical protein